jgi:hypothetical protein
MMPSSDPAISEAALLGAYGGARRYFDDWIREPLPVGTLADLLAVHLAQHLPRGPGLPFHARRDNETRAMMRELTDPKARYDWLIEHRRREPQLRSDEYRTLTHRIAAALKQAIGGHGDICVAGQDEIIPRMAATWLLKFDASLMPDSLRQYLHADSDPFPKKRPGPQKGTLSRYAASDRALYPEIRKLMADKKLSTTAAVQSLAPIIEGTGSEASRVTRVARLYRRDRHCEKSTPGGRKPTLTRSNKI